MKHTLTLLLCISLLLSALSLHALATDAQTTDTQAADSQTEQPSQTESTLTETTLPESASYIFVNAAMGYASGTLNLTMPEKSNANAYALYWGDANGIRLEGYTPFMTGEITSMTVFGSTVEGFSIPADAKTILVYTYSNQFGESTAPIKVTTTADGSSGILNYTLPKTGKQVAEFVVVGDLHIGASKTAETQFSTMLADVKRISPQANGIIVVGDATDAADAQYYTLLKQLYSNAGTLPPMYLAAGDYTYLTKGTYAYDAQQYAANLQLFLNHAGHPSDAKLDKPYYSYKLGQTRMIFLGADAYENGAAIFSKEQLAWVKQVLDDAGKYEPVLVFLHQPLSGTVSGSASAQGYNGIQNSQDLRNVLKEYDNVVLFSAHTHWSLEAEATMAYLSSGSRMFHVGSVYGLLSNQNGFMQQSSSSEGYYVTVYEDAVLIRGRNFTTGEWISTAIYMFSTLPLSAQQQQTTATTAKPSTTAKPTEEESTEEQEPGLIEELGTPLCILAGMTVIVFIVVFYKPKEQEE